MSDFIRLHITTEGPSELEFVKEILSEHLGTFNISAGGRSVLTKKDKWKSYRGGITSYSKFKRDIRNWINEEKNNVGVRFTTMIDLYGLPNDFPGYSDAQQIQNVYERIAYLEKCLGDDIGDARFIPYLQLHEYEALVFSDPSGLLLEYFDRQKEVENLNDQVNEKGNPELINDHWDTSPFRRIEKLIPEYSKVTGGVAVLKQIGLQHFRSKCSHFNDWLCVLELINA